MMAKDVVLTITETAERLSQQIADHILQAARSAVAQRGIFHLVLAGGSTPRPTYRLLATQPRRALFPWASTHFYWGDERCVPPSAEGSNYGDAWQLFLQEAATPDEQIHRMRGELAAEETALDYAAQLADMAPEGRRWPRFDLVLLGLGRDGHTASLFPEQVRELELSRPVVPVRADYDERPAERVSLTPRVFNDAHAIVFLVTGEKKAQAVAATLAEEGAGVELPASLIRPDDGELYWYLDKPAASRLDVA
ncbi:MAG: 6-phosphogluconolactonase [Candidatus Promineifilaceae bacterium]|nr:6-phosphogluconolactonase [Candidatus Promineifilaceae bacterium]